MEGVVVGRVGATHGQSDQPELDTWGIPGGKQASAGAGRTIGGWEGGYYRESDVIE